MLAQVELGKMHLHGIGIPMNKTEGIALLAAIAGVPAARELLNAEADGSRRDAEAAAEAMARRLEHV